MNKTSSNRQRLYFLDWLRIAAFSLLLPYHVGMFYVTWDWHVKSPAASHALEPLLLAISPWRLPLLFFISGAVIQSVISRLSDWGFVRQRSSKLLVPLLFGMLVVVPPQAYYEAVSKFDYSGSFVEFWGLYLKGYSGVCRGSHCLDLPAWNHLWFVPYLWLYSLIVWSLARYAPALLKRAENTFHGLVQWQIMLIPALLFMAARLLVGVFPPNHDLLMDWSSHAQYMCAFGLGFLSAAAGASTWGAMAKLRWFALAAALLAVALVSVYFYEFRDADPPAFLRIAQRLVYGGLQWWAIVAACGFALKWLNFDNPIRRWVTSAIFCFYILHQTVIVLLTRVLATAALPPIAEGLLLIVLTAVCCMVCYAVVRHIPVLRAALGVSEMPSRERHARKDLRPASD